MESLGSASPIEDTEALIYGYGAIKFLTMNTRLLKVILEQGILQLIVLHIKIINNTVIILFVYGINSYIFLFVRFEI